MEFLENLAFMDCSIGDLLLEMNIPHRKPAAIAPSYFIAEMQLSTEERLDNIKKSFLRNKKNMTDEIDIIPNIIIFQNFREDADYLIPISIINRSKVPFGIKITLEPSPYLTLITTNNMIPSKIAPGMELQCVLQFKPEIYKDYWHKLKITAAERDFIVPIIAIGPRPLLTFPDHIKISESPVHIGTEKCIHVKNISVVPGIFTVTCKKPFSVLPSSGILEPNGIMQFIIYFKPKNAGKFDEIIYVKYDSGESLKIYVEATAKCSDIYLNKSSVYFEETYLGLKCQKFIEIMNKSNHVVYFTWKKFKSSDIDKIEGNKIKASFELLREVESKKNVKLETFNVIDKDITDSIYNRIYKDELIDFDSSQHFLFSNNDFIIQPLTGEIWPNHSVEITVIFFPHSVDELSCIAYCDVTGKVDRLSLKLKGNSIGPKFKFSVETFDLGLVYLFAVQCIQIVVSNSGNIPGEIAYLKTIKFSDCEVTCDPDTLYLKPFQDGSFNICLKCTEEGSFIAETHFIIKDSQDVHKILIKARVIYAKLHLTETELNFGAVSLGFEELRILRLYNHTTINIPFTITIAPDGKTPAITYNSILRHRSSLPGNPQEYVCMPSDDIVEANSFMDVKIHLIPNQVRTFNTFLNIDSWSQINHRIAVPMSHSCGLPELIFTPSYVNIRFCFLNYLCHRLITIKNKSRLGGYIWIYTEDKPGIKIEVDIDETIIEPFGHIEVSLNIICTELGKQHSSLRFCLFGGDEKIACDIECIGQGPVVLITPENLNFGKVKCLQKVTKKLLVFNDSPTTANVQIQVKKNSPWSVSQDFVSLEPEESIYIEVTCCLYDTSRFKSKIYFDVTNRSVLECKVSATGIGTSIYVEPEICPFFNLGPQLTRTPFYTTLLFVNKGYRYHKIILAPLRNIQSFKKFEPNNYECSFKVYPDNFSLKAGESVTVSVSIQNNKEGEIQEEFFVHAIIENIQKKQIIMESTFLINLVEPTLHFSKREMNFRVDNNENSVLKIEEDILEIENISPLTLELDISVKSPFYILIDELKEITKVSQCYMRLEPTSKYYLNVFFNSETKKKVCFVVEGRVEICFRKHSRKEYIVLRGEVNFPSIKFFPNQVQFYCICPYTNPFQEVEIRNVSPLCLNYRLEWMGEHTKLGKTSIIPTKFKTPEFFMESSDSEVSSQPTIEEVEVITESEMRLLSIPVIKKKKNQKSAKKERSVSIATKDKDTRKSKSSKKSPGKKRVKLLPVQIIFQHYYIETIPIIHPVQLSEVLSGPIYKDSLINFTEKSYENLKKMKQNLYAPIGRYMADIYTSNIVKCLTDKPYFIEDIDDILDIKPSFGYLNPFESQILSISFLPKPNMWFQTKVACYVSGGLTEHIDLSGISSEIQYYLESTHVEFGRHLFNETCIKPLKLINTGLLPFTFNTVESGCSYNHTARLLEVGWIEVSPISKFLQPNEECYIIIRYTPGIAGKFIECFEIEFGEMHSVKITVSGCGVLPQVNVNLPRPLTSSELIIKCYNAIANISNRFLEYVEIDKSALPENSVTGDSMTKEEKRALQRNGWVIIANQKVPALIDINLAIERLLASMSIICNHTSLLDNTSYLQFKKLPKILASTYILDFGYILIDEMVHYVVDILNYGPGPARVTISTNVDKSDFLTTGFNIQLNNYKIADGEIEPLYIIFAPLAISYPNISTYVDITIFVQVINGLKVPINIKAIVSRPVLEITTSSLNFDQVLCGQCKIMNVEIKNVGNVPCIWHANVKPKKQDQCDQTIFYLQETKDILNPGDKKSLDITFEPQETTQYVWKLYIEVERSEKKLTVVLKGSGYLPILLIDKMRIEFEPCIPFQTDVHMFFKIENPNPFNVEYFFSDFDKQIVQEDNVVDILCQYYANNKLYMPQRNPGEKLPKAFYKFYEDLISEFKEHVLTLKLESDDDDILSRSASVRSKRPKPKRLSNMNETNTNKSSGAVIDPLTDKHPEEIYNMLKNFITLKVNEFIRSGETVRRDDPIKTALRDSKEPVYKDPTQKKEGILLIMYGAPYTGHVETANKIALKLKLQVINLDRIICETVAYSFSSAALKVYEAINDAYASIVDEHVTTLTGDDWEFFDPVALMLEKIEVINVYFSTVIKKPSKQQRSSKKSSRKSSSVKSAESKKANRRIEFDNSVTFLNISLDLIVELLCQKFNEPKTGFIVESLKNSFIRSPTLTLKTILHCVGNIRYIHGIILYDNDKQYKDRIFASQCDEYAKKETDLLTLLESFDEMTEEELDNLCPEKMHVYKEIYIAKRKEETTRRLEQLRIKIQMKRVKQDKRKAGKYDVSARFSASSHKTKRTVKSSAKESEKSNITMKRKKSTADSLKMKMTTEELIISREISDFEILLNEIRHIFEYWDRKNCILEKDYRRTGVKLSFRQKAESVDNKSKRTDKFSVISTQANAHLSSLFNREVGIPIWLINNVYDHESVGENISVLLEDNIDYQEAKMYLNESLKPQILPINETFSIISQPTLRDLQPESDVFIISSALNQGSDIELWKYLSSLTGDENIRVEHDDMSRSSISKIRKSTTNITNTTTKKKKKHKGVASAGISLKSSTDYEIIDDVLDTRSVLRPGQRNYYKIKFLPKTVGFFEYKFTIEIVGCNMKYTIPCMAICDIPRIDMNPHILFPATIREKCKKNEYARHVYILNSRVYDFGHMLVCKNKSNEDRLNMTDAYLNLRNISHLPCQIELHTIQKNEIFKLYPEKLNIHPKALEVLVINACPEKLGLNTNFLAIAIKNNPRVEIIPIQCIGCHFSFEISPKKLFYERILLHHGAVKTVKLINHSQITVYWQFSNIHLFSHNFMIEPYNGIITPLSHVDVTIEYLAPQVEIITHKKLHLEVSHEYGPSKLLLSDHIEIHAETCDLIVDCQKNINFGNAKARKNYSHVYTFLNKGKYNIIYEIFEDLSEDRSKAEKNIIKMFKINPTTGVLIPHKIFAVNIIFNAPKVINIKDFSLYKCNLMDHVTRDILSSFYITVSVNTSYSSFIIYPSPELSFGAMLVGTQARQTISITNTGLIEFDYHVLCKKTLDDIQLSIIKRHSTIADNKRKKKSKSKSSRAGSKSTKSRADSAVSKTTKKTKGTTRESKRSRKSIEKDKKIVGPPISCSVFTISNSLGTVHPKSKAVLNIDCQMRDAGEKEDTIVIFISETSPKDRFGKNIILRATGCLPSLKWDDPHLMFNQHFITNLEHEFVKPKEIQDYCVFVKHNNCLMFNNVIIRTTKSAQIELYNNSLVECDVFIQINGSSAFKAKPSKLFISSYTKANFDIEFTPPEIAVYEAIMEVCVAMPVGFKTEIKKFSLYGEGRVPMITMRQPVYLVESNNICKVTFNPTLINKCSSKLISFENTGDFPCKVIVEIYNDPIDIFLLKVTSDSEALLNCPEAENSNHSKMLKLNPNVIANIELSFQPNVVSIHNCEVKIHIVYNPFEVFQINVSGECFSEDIFLENLPTYPLEPEIVASITDVTSQYCTSYTLDFGNCPVNILQKNRIKIKNISFTEVYKFIFRAPIKNIGFIPSIGHIKPQSSKDIFITFFSDSPVSYNKLLVDCLICKIHYVEEVEQGISWDERQKLVIWEDPKKDKYKEGDPRAKLFECCSEPEYEITEDSIRRIPIIFCAFVNYSDYSLNVDAIKFLDTFMYEKRIYKFYVTNTGDVDLDIRWKITIQNFCKIPPPEENLSPREKKKLKSAQMKKFSHLDETKPRKLTGLENFFGDQCNSNKVGNNELMNVGFHMPFSIEPDCILLAPKKVQEVSLMFSPLDVFKYKARLKGSVKNLIPDKKEIDIEVSAKSLVPCCHFDVKLSDYISSKRRKQHLKECDIVDVNAINTKCIEFHCLGIGIQHSISFNIINPTPEDLEYTWDEIKSYEISSVPLFTCKPLRGVISCGKFSEVTFSVFPQATGIFEALYNFKIDKYKLSMQFLIVANVREVDVKFLIAHLNLKPCVLGIPVHDTIILRNNEDLSIGFRINKNSLFSEGKKQFITVEPKKGTIPKQSDMKLKISYNATDIGEEHFTLTCNVDYCQNPISLGINAKCYEVEAVVQCLMQSGKKMFLTSDLDNVINFKDMLPQHEEVLTFCIRNEGNIGFYYYWTYTEQVIERKFKLNIPTKEGYIKTNTESVVGVRIEALRNATLKNFKLNLVIKYGPTFRMLLNGTVSNTAYKFSFMEYDFGPCLVQNCKICYYHKALEFSNYGNNAVTLECNFVNTNYLLLDFKIKKILPKSKQIINICFQPKKVQKYITDIFFNINNQKAKIKILGEGIQLNIAVVNIEDKTIHLGSPQIGQVVSKTIKVINRSPIPVKALFDIWDRLPSVLYPNPPASHYLEIPKKERILEDSVGEDKSDRKDGKRKSVERKVDRTSKASRVSRTSRTSKRGRSRSTKSSSTTRKSRKSRKSGSRRKSKLDSSSGKSKKSKKSRKSKLTSEAPLLLTVEPDIDTQETLRLKAVRDSITVYPKSPITIFPDKQAEIVIHYLPTQKLLPFTEKISAQVLESVQPLLILKGACSGPIFYLDRTEISFGAVVLHCSRINKVMLINEGDTSSKFKWEIDCPADFSITPVEGHSMVGQKNTFTVEYHPTQLNIQSKCIGKLILDSYEKPLYLNLIGLCANIPEPTAILEFSCPVRNVEKKIVSLSNPSNRHWKLYPYIDCEQFSCNVYVNVKSKSETKFDIFYKPFRMTKTELHQGTLFFKIPDGQAIVYKLIGKAGHPDPIKVINIETPCKVNYTQILPLNNWSTITQIYKVYTEDRTADREINYYEIKGNDIISIKANGYREYEWHFYAYKECLLDFRVIFMNSDGEYMFYQLVIKVTKCKPLKTINLSTCLRTAITHKLTLINPLDIPVTYKITSNSHALFHNNFVTVEPHSEIEEDIKFKPIVCETLKAQFDATCPELGTYLYECNLTGLPPISESTIYFTAELGKFAISSARIENLSKYKATFTLEIGHEESFEMNKTITVGVGQTSQIYIKFMPCEIGKIETNLLVNSNSSGEYIFPIIATCIMPKPKGPYLIKPEVIIAIDFTNPFLTEYKFKYIIDPSDIFILIQTEETIPSKSSTRINIKLIDEFESDQNVKGKLTVLPQPAIAENVKWSYYLQTNI